MTFPPPMNAPSPPSERGAVIPGARSIVRARTIIVKGAGGGEFVYSAAGVLQSSNCGAPTTDPIQHVACPQGFATYNQFGAVINLLSTSLNAFFQYFDNGNSTQGGCILAVSSKSGVDPLNGQTYSAGLNGFDPVFGDFINVAGAVINLGQLTYTRLAQVLTQQAGSPGANPYVKVDAPEQGTAEHMQLLLQGDSPNGASPSQMLLGRVSGAAVLGPLSNSMAEIQDSTGNGGLFISQPLAPASAGVRIVGQRGGDRGLAISVTGDTNSRIRVDTNGKIDWSQGGASFLGTLALAAANLLAITNADWSIATLGHGLRIAEGANGRMGQATLVGGKVTVANTTVTANTRIYLSRATAGGGLGELSYTIVAGTSFTINSSSVTDTSVINWLLIEKA